MRRNYLALRITPFCLGWGGEEKSGNQRYSVVRSGYSGLLVSCRLNYFP
jgi:hypothetical protein